MADTSNWKLFEQLWATAFRPIKKEDGIIYWERFVNKCKWNMLEQAFGIMKDQHMAKKRNGINMYMPRLTDLEEVYTSLEVKENQLKNPTQVKCEKCDGCGWVKTVQYQYNGRWYVCDPKQVLKLVPEIEVGILAGPCTCVNSSSDYPESFKHEIATKNFGSMVNGRGDEDYYIKCCRCAGKEEPLPERPKPDVIQFNTSDFKSLGEFLHTLSRKMVQSH